MSMWLKRFVVGFYKTFTIENIVLQLLKAGLRKGRVQGEILPEEVGEFQKYIKRVELYIQKGYPKSKILRPLDRLVLTPLRIAFILLVLGAIVLGPIVANDIFGYQILSDNPIVSHPGDYLLLLGGLFLLLLFIQPIENLIFFWLASRWAKKHLEQ